MNKINNASVEQYLSLLNNLDDAVFIIDKYGKTIYANNKTFDMYGCSIKEYFNTYMDTQYLLDNGILDTCAFWKVIETKKPVAELVSVMNVKGIRNEYYIKKLPIFDSMGEVEYVVGWARRCDTIRELEIQIDNWQVYQSNIQLRMQNVDTPFIYKNKEMDLLIKFLLRVAPSTSSVMIVGETGVGKEVVANFIHQHSERKNNNMVTVNCAALSPSLFESELFGYTKGSFTGANPEGSAGLIEEANNSTLFLDEIDSIPLELQGKLLRALETKKIRRIGSNVDISVNFRLITATNKNLSAMMKSGKFRSDLYYRINVLKAEVPALRERKDDIRPLAEYFLNYYCEQYGIIKKFNDSVFDQLETYDWPGNVRELKNVIERTVVTSSISSIEIQNVYIPEQYTEEIEPMSNSQESEEFQKISSDNTITELTLTDRVMALEKDLILHSINRCKSYTNTANELGISVSTLERKMKKYGIGKD